MAAFLAVAKVQMSSGSWLIKGGYGFHRSAGDRGYTMVGGLQERFELTKYVSARPVFEGNFCIKGRTDHDAEIVSVPASAFLARPTCVFSDPEP